MHILSVVQNKNIIDLSFIKQCPVKYELDVEDYPINMDLFVLNIINKYMRSWYIDLRNPEPPKPDYDRQLESIRLALV